MLCFGKEISDLMTCASERCENMKTSPNGKCYTSVAIVNAIGDAIACN